MREWERKLVGDGFALQLGVFPHRRWEAKSSIGGPDDHILEMHIEPNSLLSVQSPLRQ